MFRPCAVIPTHNHHRVLAGIVSVLRDHGLPVIVVDDASGEPARTAIAALCDPEGGVEVLRLASNQGKGGAVAAGLSWAAERGFSHAVQVDADGQHDLGALVPLLATARAHPEALVSGRPVYDRCVPRMRLIARWLTHVWVWVETLSTRIADSMCGFRVYPLAAVMAVLARERVGRRMDFDPEIMVRLFWRGVPIVQVPVAVTYPEGNTSNFHMVRDNWLLTRMHTRLCLTMLWRLPSILRHRPPAIGAGDHWSAMGERGAQWGMRLVWLIYATVGRYGCLAILWPIVTYFFLTDGNRRRHSRAFLARVSAVTGGGPPRWIDSLRHFMSFAEKILETFIAWAAPQRAGHLTVHGGDEMDRLVAEGIGGLLIVSHLGNAELCRARLTSRFGSRISILLYTRHAVHYNRLLKSIRPDVDARTIQVTEIGPEIAIQLKERVERGEWIAMAGDRTPVLSQGRVSVVDFLGAPAPFPQGPYILAALLGCPVYLMVCLREEGGHVATFERLADRVVLPRRGKNAALDALAARYAARLQDHCLQAPRQWYNFFDFWVGPNGNTP